MGQVDHRVAPIVDVQDVGELIRQVGYGWREAAAALDGRLGDVQAGGR